MDEFCWIVGRADHPNDTVIQIEDVKIGGNEIIIFAGPYTVESVDQIERIAVLVRKAGAKILRGGYLNSYASPYSFQGLDEKHL